MLTEIEMIEAHAENIRNGTEKVSPGSPASFTRACVNGDAIWQGDLLLVLTDDNVPEGFSVSDKPTKQLVPGENVGAKHCLDSLANVDIFYPQNWNEESLIGPYFKVKDSGAVVEHPVHGDVSIPAGFSVQCFYQREYDKELEKERRAKD
jgi:hypothetical protein